MPRLRIIVCFLAALLLAGCGGAKPRPQPPAFTMKQAPPRADPTWPWPNATTTSPTKGVTRYFATSGDKTETELLKFDFHENPRLKFELYDQDETGRDDANYFDRGVGAVVHDLNKTGH